MKVMNVPRTCSKFLALPALLGAFLFAVPGARAHPYATCLTNDSGVVSFRLNEVGASVLVIGNAGTLTNDLGALPYGLTVTNLATSGLTGGVFKVVVSKNGTGSPSQINEATNKLSHFYSPRGVAVNRRPGSPFFGRIYVGNASAGTTAGSASGRVCQDGIYILNADITDLGGNNVTNATYYNALTGGINMATGGSSMPWRLRVGADDDMLYICDWSDPSGNLWQADADVAAGSGTNVLQVEAGPLVGTGIGLPPGYNHGSVSEVIVTGSLGAGNLTVYSVDEDYESNPGFLSELNSLWQFNIGSGPFPWTAVPDLKVATPAVAFTGQTMGLDRGTNGYFYLLNNRSSGNENLLQVIDPVTQAVLYESRTESLNLGFTYDYLSNSVSVAVSSDMRFCAAIRNNGFVVVMPMVDGIPSLAKRIEFNSGFGGTTARQLAFDAADNLYMISSGAERLRVFSLGLTTTITTSTDGSFGVAMPAATVSVAVDQNTVSEAAPAQLANFTFTRANDDNSRPLPVNISVSGTATRGIDYGLLTNGVLLAGSTAVIPANSSTLQVSLVLTNDTTSELTETVVLNVGGGGNYNSEEPSAATVAIVDDETPMVDVGVVFIQMYEGLANDYIEYRLTRRGDTNAGTFAANLTWQGTAAAARYTAPTTVTIEPGTVTTNFTIAPLDDALLQGNQTIICRIASGSGYLAGTNSPTATGTIVDDEVLPGTELFSESFNTDTSAAWTTRFGSGNSLDDFRSTFGYDYGSGTIIPMVPSAPHSSGDTHGLYLTVNKDEGSTLGAAGINVYPTGQTFSGNFTVRFDMYLMVGSSASTTEYALFGINHDTTHANWFRNSGAIPNSPTFDGVWFGVEADGAALGDYAVYSAPTTALGNPTALTPGVNAATLTGVLKAPPYSFGGAPGNLETTMTPAWTAVEIDKVGRYIRLKLNNSPIMTYSNATPFTAGNIMLGYCDAYDSIQTGNSGVIYDNLKVARIDDLKITPAVPSFSGTNVVIGFTFGLDEPTTAFRLQSAAAVAGPYANATAAIARVSPGAYTATSGTNANRFYRVNYVMP